MLAALFHDRGGPYGRTKGAKLAISVDITGLPLAARVLPASTTESDATGLLLADIVDAGQADRLELVIVDKGTSQRKADALSKRYGLEVRRVFWETKPVDPRTGERIFKPLPHAGRVEVAHSHLGRSRRLAKSFENPTVSATAWLHLACIHLNLAAIEPYPIGKLGGR